MTKRALSLYVDTNLIEIAKAKNINMSQLFERVLENIAEKGELLETMEEDTIKENIIKLTENLNTNKALLLQIDIKKKGKLLSEEEVVVNEN